MTRSPWLDIGTPVLGLPLNALANPTTYQTIGAGTRLALGFYLEHARTLVRFAQLHDQGAGTASLVSMNASVHTVVYGSAGAIPGEMLGGVTLAPGSYGGFPCWKVYELASPLTLPRGQYCIVYKNTAAAPTVNYCGTQYLGSIDPYFSATSALGSGAGAWKLHSTTSGVTWVTPVLGQGLFLMEFSDGTFKGLPISGLYWGDGAVTDFVFLDQLAGVSFVTPSGAAMWVVGGALPVKPVAAAVGGLRIELHHGGADGGDMGWTCQLGYGGNSVNGMMFGTFLTPVLLQPDTAYRLVVRDTNLANDYNTTGYHEVRRASVINVAGALSVIPFQAQATNYYSSEWSETPGWVDDPARTSPFLLMLDSVAPFESVSAGGGGPVIGSRIIRGMAS